MSHPNQPQPTTHRGRLDEVCRNLPNSLAIYAAVEPDPAKLLCGTDPDSLEPYGGFEPEPNGAWVVVGDAREALDDAQYEDAMRAVGFAFVQLLRVGTQIGVRAGLSEQEARVRARAAMAYMARQSRGE